MKRAMRIYVHGIKISLSSAMAYRADFLLNTLISLAGNLVMPMLTLLIYNAGASFPGWSIYEVMLIQSVFLICNGICSTLFSSLVNETMYRIKEGSYDLIMIKPGSAAFITISTSFNLEGIGIFIAGVTLFVNSLFHLQTPSAAGWLAFVLLFIMGIAVILGYNLVMAATSFKWVGNSRIYEIFNSTVNFGKYPIQIFPRALTAAASFVVPVAMIGFFPASALLGRFSIDMFIAAFPCVLFLCFGMWLFGHMVRKYQSAGG